MKTAKHVTDEIESWQDITTRRRKCTARRDTRKQTGFGKQRKFNL